MAIGRLAGSLIKRAALPHTAGGWAFELGPELLFAGMAAASVPEGTPMMDRLMMAGEDFVLGAGGSLGGRLGGAAIGGKLGRSSARAMTSAIEQGAMAGGMVGGMGVPMFAPRPFADHLRRKAEEQMGAEQTARDQAIYEQGMLASHLANSPRVNGIDQMLMQVYSNG